MKKYRLEVQFIEYFELPDELDEEDAKLRFIKEVIYKPQSDPMTFILDHCEVVRIEDPTCLPDTGDADPTHWEGNGSPYEARWREEFGSAVEGPATVVCDGCGATLMGVEPARRILCLPCYVKEKCHKNSEDNG